MGNRRPSSKNGRPKVGPKKLDDRRSAPKKWTKLEIETRNRNSKWKLEMETRNQNSKPFLGACNFWGRPSVVKFFVHFPKFFVQLFVQLLGTTLGRPNFRGRPSVVQFLGADLRSSIFRGPPHFFGADLRSSIIRGRPSSVQLLGRSFGRPFSVVHFFGVDLRSSNF